jgi:hypothetical protein
MKKEPRSGVLNRPGERRRQRRHQIEAKEVSVPHCSSTAQCFINESEHEIEEEGVNMDRERLTCPACAN